MSTTAEAHRRPGVPRSGPVSCLPGTGRGGPAADADGPLPGQLERTRREGNGRTSGRGIASGITKAPGASGAPRLPFRRAAPLLNSVLRRRNASMARLLRARNMLAWLLAVRHGAPERTAGIYRGQGPWRVPGMPVIVSCHIVTVGTAESINRVIKISQASRDPGQVEIPERKTASPRNRGDAASVWQKETGYGSDQCWLLVFWQVAIVSWVRWCPGAVRHFASAFQDVLPCGPPPYLVTGAHAVCKVSAVPVVWRA